MGVIETLGAIIGKAWELWNYDFTVSGITFSLFDVAVVAVGVWVGSLLWTGIVEGGGDD